MKLSGETANLEFDTGALLVPATTSRSLFLTQTFNMRAALGDMFDKYDEFLIVFNSLGASTNSTSANSYTAGSVANQNQTAVWSTGISGDLQFTNNTINGQISNIAFFPPRYTLPVATVAASANVLFNFPINNGVTFLKPQNDFVTLTITPYLIRAGGAGSVVAGATDLTIDINLSFTVFGLMKEEHKTCSCHKK
jgi:hypothetical protein